MDTCECPDCNEADTPCACDCDRDEECQGCTLARETLEEEVYDSGIALGIE